MPRIGTRKLYHLLKEELKTAKVGRDMLFRILKANHLLIKRKKQYHITTNSFHRFYKHKNMTEDLIPSRPEQLWVSDITYIGTRQNPMYLALVTDAYSKKVVGYDVSNSLATQGTIRALKMAIKGRKERFKKLIHHSDRGLQYCSNEYQELLNKKKISCSMTEKYDPYQNAVAERINGVLKQEFINGIEINDINLMKLFMADAISIYNQKRPHWSNHMLTPNQMHKQEKMKIRTYKTKYESSASATLI